MKVFKETLFERIRNRLAPANAVEVITALQRATAREEISYMAVKEASEMVDRYRLEARSAIRSYRVWQTKMMIRQLSRPLHDQEGRLLMTAARASSSLYLDAKRDYLDLVALSIANCQDQPANDA